MANQFSIDVDQSNDGIKVVSVPKTWLEGGNTPNWITPVVNYGMTSGGILIPQRVDSEGRPEITQTGSIVKTENIITRGIYTSALPTRVKNVPPGAIGCTVSLIIHGVTGTFTAEEGVRGNLYVYTRDNTSSNYSRVVLTKNKSTRGGQIFQFFPGANTVSSEGDYASDNIKLHEGLRVGFYCVITGTFEAGEGFDLEVDITWMY